MKNLIILGASGSIGTQAISVIRQHPDLFNLVGFSVGERTECVNTLIEEFNIKYLTVKKEEDYLYFSKKYESIHIYFGDEGLLQLIRECPGDTVINALIGMVGFLPTIEILNCNKQLLLANKESLVVGGYIVMDLAKQKGINVIPIDSEHSAIFQCLQGNDIKQVNRLIITASGGAFRDYSREMLKDATVQKALQHPNWLMGKKITIDCATMMNKGFEVIEAHWLFDLPYEKIETIIHPQSIVHSIVEYDDHSQIAQLGVSDMRIPIQYSLCYPQRFTNETKALDLAEVRKLEFRKMDFERYPMLELAYNTGRKGGNLPAFLNGANESAVNLFLQERITYLQLEEIISLTMKKVLETDMFIEKPSIKDVVYANNYAYQFVKEYFNE